MKRTIALILTLLLCAATAANTALAMTEEEALKAVKEAEGAYAPGDPLTMDDFKVYSSTTDFDRYDNNVLSFMKGERFGSYNFVYANWPEFSDTGRDKAADEDQWGSITYRGVRGGEDNSKEVVLQQYGLGIPGRFDKQTDILYKSLHKKEEIWFRDYMEQYCASWLLYNYENKAQIIFYFTADDKVTVITYYPDIKVSPDRETTKAIQACLNDAGYDCGTPDGVAGKKTRTAIKKFQKDHDLFQSGLIDDSLLKCLEKQNIKIDGIM